MDAPGASPAEKAGGAEDEAPHDDLVLAAVALDAGGQHVGVFGGGVLADGQVLRQAVGVRALGARGLRAEPDQRAVLETGAFAEDGGRCRTCGFGC